MAALVFRVSKRPNAAIVFASVIYRYIFPIFTTIGCRYLKKKAREKRFSYLLWKKGNKWRVGGNVEKKKDWKKKTILGTWKTSKIYYIPIQSRKGSLHVFLWFAKFLPPLMPLENFVLFCFSFRPLQRRKKKLNKIVPTTKSRPIFSRAAKSQTKMK